MKYWYSPQNPIRESAGQTLPQVAQLASDHRRNHRRNLFRHGRHHIRSRRRGRRGDRVHNGPHRGGRPVDGIYVLAAEIEIWNSPHVLSPEKN